MSAYSGEALQVAIYKALAADAALLALVDGIYDQVPDNALFPYVHIGELSIRNYDDKTDSGSDISITLHCFSQDRDKQISHQILDRLHVILHRADLSVTDQNLVDLQFDNFAQVFQEKTDNNVTYHGVIRFRAFTTPI